MDTENLKRLYAAFSSVEIPVYLREEEAEAIRSFVASKKPVLHICGNPGVGKTHVTTRTVGNSSLYLNHYIENDILGRIKANDMPVVIIDEFDRYYSEKRAECLQTMCYLKAEKTQLITISNNLRMTGDVLFFKPYTSVDMEKILTQKVTEESALDVLGPTTIRIMSKRIGPSGDLRQLFRHVQEVVGKKIVEGCGVQITPEDIMPEKENKEERQNNIHHDIISSLILRNRKTPRMGLYSKYLRECQEMKIPSYDRADFNVIYDIYA